MKFLPLFLLLVQLVLQVTTETATALQGILSLTSLCDHPPSVIYVKDAITLLADTMTPHQTANLSHNSVLCKTAIDSSDPDVAGFLVNVENNLPTQGDHCAVRSKLFRLRDERQTLSVGCSHHLTQFFARPLRLTFRPTVLRQLVAAYRKREGKFASDAFTVTITAVAHDCASNRKLTSKKWSRCQQAEICIPSQLFCDGVNNCGLGEDERNCVFSNAATTMTTRTATKTTTKTIGAITSAETLIPAFADMQTESGSNVMITASPTNASIAMVMGFFLMNGFCIGFFIFLGLCSIGCCCSSCLYRAESEKSRRTFIGYFRKFGSFGTAKTDAAPTEAADGAPARKTSATWSISAQQDEGGIVRPQSPPPLPPPAYTSQTLKFPTLFGLNLRNERHMRECEPEVEDGGDDGGNMSFLSSMLREHHSRTNNMLASALLPVPTTSLLGPSSSSKRSKKRPFLPGLGRFKRN
uniref:Uncharacterized protein n=1 Tax=Plectus sambesii TaxID=2011161 RepID=A0A914V703_9BILA